MTQQPDAAFPGDEAETPAAAKSLSAPTVADDLLLLLFQPESGAIAGENTLFYVLAGAVLAELALEGSVTITKSATGTASVDVIGGRAPSDEILRPAWNYVSGTPRGVQAVLAAIGPTLREPLLERLIARGDIRREQRRMLGLFPTTALADGGSGRRAAVLAEVRAALVDGVEPTPRVAALAALVWASGTLPQFHPGIPWNSSVIARAQELERGNWGAGAAAEAVARTVNAIIAGMVIVAATVAARGPGR